MDRETQEQLDEYHIERELTDTRETIIRLIVEGLDGHDPECLCHEWRRFQIIDLKRHERKLRRSANLPEFDLDIFEEWRCDDAITLQEWQEQEEEKKFLRILEKIMRPSKIDEAIASDIASDEERFSLCDTIAAMSFEEWLAYYRKQPGGWLVTSASEEILRAAYEQRLNVYDEEDDEED